MQFLRENGEADIIDIIKTLRTCRGGMVQHPEQAEFVHTCLARYVAAHGSINEVAVLEDALRKADAAVPKGQLLITRTLMRLVRYKLFLWLATCAASSVQIMTLKASFFVLYCIA